MRCSDIRSEHTTRALVQSLAVGVFVVIVFLSGSVLGCSVQTNKIPEKNCSSDAALFGGRVFSNEGESVDLGRGEYFVAVLDASCDNCRDSVLSLNDLATIDEFPKIVSLVMANQGELAEFKRSLVPSFPVFPIDVTDFYDWIVTAPPCFYIVNDGTVLRRLDVREPSVEEFLAFAGIFLRE